MARRFVQTRGRAEARKEEPRGAPSACHERRVESRGETFTLISILGAG